MKTRYIYLGDIYFCNRYRQYKFLTDKGFKPIGTKPDPVYEDRIIFMFDRDTVIDALNEYQENQGNFIVYKKRS